jgi:hypothetical protein
VSNAYDIMLLKAYKKHALTPLILVLLASSAKAQTEPKDSGTLRPAQPLELRLIEPLRWENGCLRIELSLVNRSEVPVFLPSAGLYIDSSTKLLSNVPQKNGSEEWQNVYGFSDHLRLIDAKSLAPGALVHKNHCVGPTVAVVKLQSETRRELPLRGRLRIYTSYYLSDPNPATNKRPQGSSDSAKLYLRVVQPSPEISTLIVAIPCPERGCPLGCSAAPLILEGEGVIVPDVYVYQPEWVERGKAVDAELNRLFPCSE